jgi:hypothetical protein
LIQTVTACVICILELGDGGDSAGCRGLAGLCEGTEGEGDDGGEIILLLLIRKERSFPFEGRRYFLHSYVL